MADTMDEGQLRIRLAEATAEIGYLRALLRGISRAATVPLPEPECWDDYRRTVCLRMYDIASLTAQAATADHVAVITAIAAQIDRVTAGDLGYIPINWISRSTEDEVQAPRDNQ